MPSLVECHQVLLNRLPTESQKNFYLGSYKGYAGKDVSHIEAVVISALMAGDAFSRVVMLVPIPQEQIFLNEFKRIGEEILDTCKALPAEKRKITVDGYLKLLKKVLMTGKLLQLEQEPMHWRSWGFEESDHLPDWMSQQLIHLR